MKKAKLSKRMLGIMKRYAKSKVGKATWNTVSKEDAELYKRFK